MDENVEETWEDIDQYFHSFQLVLMVTEGLLDFDRIISPSNLVSLIQI